MTFEARFQCLAKARSQVLGSTPDIVSSFDLLAMYSYGVAKRHGRWAGG